MASYATKWVDQSNISLLAADDRDQCIKEADWIGKSIIRVINGKNWCILREVAALLSKQVLILTNIFFLPH